MIMGWIFEEKTENKHKEEENPRSMLGSQQVGSNHGPMPRLGPRNRRKCSWAAQ